MQEFETTLEEVDSSADRGLLKERLWEFLTFLFKRFVVFVSFGPGVLGLLWLLGRIFRKR